MMGDIKRPHWTERLFASASASTIKIAGVGKKLRNKVILLRGVFTPPCIKAVHTHSGHGWESQFTAPPPPPEMYQSLSPAVPKHDSAVSQRIICVKDLNPALFGDQSPESDWSSDEKDEVRSFLSGHHRPGKPLSTLPEEEDELEEDIYVDALVMPLEQLQSIPDVAKTFGSPDRSHVSPPWMHKQLTSDGSSTLTSLGANAISRNMDALNINPIGSNPSTMYCDLDGRPSFASEDRRTFNSGSSPTGSRNLAPSIKSPIANSFMSEQFRDRRVSQLSASSFGINLGLGSGEVYMGSGSKRPVSANLSVCESMTTNGRRRSSSLVMLPNRNSGKKGGSGVSSTGGRGKENTELGGRDQDRRFKAIRDQERGMEGDDSDEDEDDGDESDDEGTQNYYVYEAASLVTDSDDGGERNSVLILMPIPEDEQKTMRQREAEENDLTSRWSAVSDDLTPRSSIWGTAPLPPSSPLPPYSPEMSPSPILGHPPSLLRSALPPKPKRPPPAPPTSNRQEQPQEAPATTDPVVFSWSKATQTTTAVPVPVPSPALAPKTLSAPPPPKKTIPAAGLGGYVPLPPPPPPRKPSSYPHPPIGKSRSLKYRAGASKAFASSDTSVGNPNNPGLIRVRSASTRASTPPPRSERVIPLSSHVKLSSDVVRTIPPPTTTQRKHRSTPSQRLLTPSTPSNSHSRKDRFGYTRGDDSQCVSGGDDRVRMAKNDEFIRSSGRAFQGQSFRAIQVLDEYSGAMEVHVGKGVKNDAENRDSHGGIRSSTSAPSFPSPNESSQRHSVRPRPSI